MNPSHPDPIYHGPNMQTTEQTHVIDTENIDYETLIQKWIDNIDKRTIRVLLEENVQMHKALAQLAMLFSDDKKQRISIKTQDFWNIINN